MPFDHLPQSLRDGDCLRREQEIERRKSLFRQARGISSALRSIVDKQPKGGLTRAEGMVLSVMVLQNLRACVRRERVYRPSRKGIAQKTGYSERTVSKCLSRIKDVGPVVVERYGRGGRFGDKGKGLATEFRSGCLQFLSDQLAALGYRLPKALRDDLEDLGRWAAQQVGEHTATQCDQRQAGPTGKQVPGTLYLTDTGSPGSPEPAPVEAEQGPTPGEPTGRSGVGISLCRGLGHEHGSTRRHRTGLERRAMGRLASAARATPEPLSDPPGICGLHCNEHGGNERATFEAKHRLEASHRRVSAKIGGLQA